MAKQKTIQTVVNPRRIRRGAVLTLVLSDGEHEEVRVSDHGDNLDEYAGTFNGYGSNGARMIREAAAAYLEAFRALDPESRAKQLLAEADAYRDRCHLRLREAITATAAELAEDGGDDRGGLDVSAVERALKREDAAYEARSALYNHLELIFGEHLRARWEREEEAAETLPETV